MICSKLTLYIRYRSGTLDDSLMDLSCRLFCRLGSHWHASKCQGESVGVGMPGKAM